MHSKLCSVTNYLICKMYSSQWWMLFLCLGQFKSKKGSILLITTLGEDWQGSHCSPGMRDCIVKPLHLKRDKESACSLCMPGTWTALNTMLNGRYSSTNMSNKCMIRGQLDVCLLTVCITIVFPAWHRTLWLADREPQHWVATTKGKHSTNTFDGGFWIISSGYLPCIHLPPKFAPKPMMAAASVITIIHHSILCFKKA